jgi:glyoxylase-like metal-dependent hydrolase (beta-lactamase superfamily II)
MRIHPIETGFFSTEASAMYGKYGASFDNPCRLTMRSIYAEWGNRKVLFDAGVGIAEVQGLEEYYFEDGQDLIVALEGLGCKPDQLTDVVLSHLHFDHCGGLVVRGPEGELRPAFPKAKCWVSRRQWELAQNPSAFEIDSYVPELLRVLESLNLFRFVDTDGPLFPGLTVELYNGHTQGQLVSWLTSRQGQCFVLPGDVIPTKQHLFLDCISAFDCSELESVREKMRLLERLKAWNGLLFFYHDIVTESVSLCY